MSIIRSALKVGGFTTISRVLGFIRDQLIAFTLGTGDVADAFVVAQRLPNLFRTLFAEGAFNSSFVPLFAKRVEGEGAQNARIFAREVYSVMLVWITLFSAVAIIAMPWLIYLIGWGFKGSPEKFQLLILLTQICFPYLIFMCLTALQGGVLNSMNRFTAAAAAPILLNIVMIASNAVAWWEQSGNSAKTGYIFAWGITLSGVAQFILMALACQRAGMSLIPSWPRLTPGVKQVFRNAVPGLISGGVMQINLLIATSIATGIDHANSYLYYADRLYQLPLGIIGVAIGVVLLPQLSRKLRAGDPKGALDASNRALEFSLFLTLPAAAALVAIGQPILHTVFEHGNFKYDDTIAVTPAVMAFAAGLPAYSLAKVFQPGFYAREDTRTPMWIALISVVFNIIGSFVLSRYIDHVGIALATSLAAWINSVILYAVLLRRGQFSFEHQTINRLWLILLSTLIMVAALVVAHVVLYNNFAKGASTFASLWSLAVLLLVGILSYFGAAQLTGAWTFSELKAALRR